jgi:hypothetical protein
VLLDTLAELASDVLVAPGHTRVELVAAAIANVVVHEAGHLFGDFHTSDSNARLSVMDPGGRMNVFFELGPDGVFGTRDDAALRFGNDDFSVPEGMSGTQDTLNRIAFGLETARTLPPPLTQLAQLVPHSVLAGDLGAQLVALGNGFTPLSRVAVGATRPAPRFENRRALTIPLDPALLRAPGTVPVRVATPNGGGTSQVGTLEVVPSLRVLDVSFEHGRLGGFVSSEPVGVLAWTPTTHRSASPPTSLYFGDPATFTYDTGMREAGSFTSAPLTLPAGAVLSFASYLDTERDLAFDEAKVEISSDGFATSRVVVSNHDGTLLDGPHSFPGGRFQRVSADLSAFAGQIVQLRFAFDSQDESGNGFEGWYVDDIAILAPDRR